jgi:hypothetical protein
MKTNVGILVNMRERHITRTGDVQRCAAAILKLVIEEGAERLDTGWSVELDQTNGVITIRPLTNQSVKEVSSHA